MTSTMNRRPGSIHASRPASWAPAGEWRLYRAWGDLPPESGWRQRALAWLLGGRQQLLYIGITGRTTVARWAEHLVDKWWASDVATWERDTRVWPSKETVEAAEKAAIERERPVHNIAHNGNNPGAVRVRRHLPRHVVRARLHAAGWAVVWLLLAVTAWQGGADAGGSAAGATVVTGVLLVWRQNAGKPKRRTRRRGRGRR